MDNLHVVSRQHGLTLAQWSLLFAAFMIGLGSSFVVREIFPPAHAGLIQTAPSSPDSAR
jgi:uncharacterized membrane protein YczE